MDFNDKEFKSKPLADRMKPIKLEDFVGQEDIIGEDKLLSRLIEADRLSSMIIYGPPGIGKTSLANVIANTTKSLFFAINATNSSKGEMEKIIDEIHEKHTRAVLYIDEIHRFNKAQQDYLLPFVECGDVILIGTTTESPYHEVNKALISRSTVFEMKRLSSKDIVEIVKRALVDKERGLGNYNVNISEECFNIIGDYCEGDARNALNVLELAVLTTRINRQTGTIDITKEVIENCMQKKALKYDQSGINHYDTISAFIKSMRGSDPQAVNYYLAVMLQSGEDIKFIARRIVICASEDVGLADPMALVVAMNAANAVEFIGMPEARIILAEAATYVALAPKSNSSYNAINSALDYVEKHGVEDIPVHLRDATRGVGYKYAHAYPNHFVDQQYMPLKLKDLKFFEAGELGKEKELKEYGEHINNKKF